MSSSSSQSNSVHFFREILERTLRREKLRVPTSFMKRYWEGMSNPVTLRLPNKTEWKVGWEKEDGDVWFCNGWKEFADYVSLSVSQLVVFHFQDKSCFSVIILGKRGLEIKYPVTTDTTATTPTAEEEDEEEIDQSDFDLPPSLPSKRPKSAPQSSQPHKKRKTNPKDQKESRFNKLQSSDQHHHKKKMKKKITYGKKKVEAHSRFDNAAAKYMNSGSKDLQERIKAFHEKIKNYVHSKKDYFICIIKESFLLVISNEFSRSNLGKMEGRIAATLFVDDQDTTWDVKLKLHHDQLHFTAGWKEFSMDNNLKIGDICAFVLNKTKELSFQIVNEGSKNDKNESIKKFHEYVKKRFRSKKDFFTCAMYKTYVNTDYMVLPKEFSKHLVKMDGRSVSLFVVGTSRTWDVQLKKLQNGHFTFTSGWIKFSKDNGLKIGDVCAFVFTKTKGISFQVFNHPFEKDLRTPLFEENSSDQKELLNRPSSSSLSPHREPNSPKVRSRCMSEQEFILNITNTPSQMSIPIKYIKNFISESGKFVTLRVGKNAWPVKVLLYECYSLAKFSQGWSKFIQDCQLKEGDSCYFKLVNEKKLEFEVTINSKMHLLN